MALTRYLVFEPAAAAEPSEKTQFVRDRFSWAAFLLPFFWLLRYRLWWAALAVLVLSLLFGWLGQREGFGTAGTVLSLLVGLLVALEGPSLRAARLGRTGHREATVLYAESLSEAEWLYSTGRQPIGEAPSPVTIRRSEPRSETGGWRPYRTLFDRPGER